MSEAPAGGISLAPKHPNGISLKRVRILVNLTFCLGKYFSSQVGTSHRASHVYKLFLLPSILPYSADRVCSTDEIVKAGQCYN